MIKYPAWYTALPLKSPKIVDGKNQEGLTWQEWRAAAGRPKSMLEESWWIKAWECGVDPTEMRAP